MAGTSTRRAALVLSGGGALGAAHIGAAEALEDRGGTFDFFAGVSAGAIVAALLASGRRPTEAWRAIVESKVLKLLFDISWKKFGLIRGEKVRAAIGDVIGEATFESLPHPLHIGTTDLVTGERVSIASGCIADAIRASISIPVLFEPFRHPGLGRWLADGGLVENLPLSAAAAGYRGDRIIAVDVATAIDGEIDFGRRPDGSKGRTLMGLLGRSLKILLRSQQAGPPGDPRVAMVVPDLGRYGPGDILKLGEIREKGREAVEEDQTLGP